MDMIARVNYHNIRSSLPEVFCRKGVVKKESPTLSRKRLLHRYFLYKVCEIIKSTNSYRAPMVAVSPFSLFRSSYGISFAL